MKLSIYKFFQVGAMALAFMSCNDFLDQNPDERVDIDTEEKVVQLLSTAYSNANYGYLCEMSSDNIIDNNSPHRPADPDSRVTSVYYNLAPYERIRACRVVNRYRLSLDGMGRMLRRHSHCQPCTPGN